MWLTVTAILAIIVVVIAALTRSAREPEDRSVERDINDDVDDMVLYDMVNEEDEFNVGA